MDRWFACCGATAATFLLFACQTPEGAAAPPPAAAGGVTVVDAASPTEEEASAPDEVFTQVDTTDVVVQQLTAAMMVNDANGDQVLSRDELLTRAFLLLEADTSGDEVIDREEAIAHAAKLLEERGRDPAAAERHAEDLLSHDRDGNGSVERSELEMQVTELLADSDANGDSALDLDEVQAHLRTVVEAFKRKEGPR